MDMWICTLMDIWTKLIYHMDVLKANRIYVLWNSYSEIKLDMWSQILITIFLCWSPQDQQSTVLIVNHHTVDFVDPLCWLLIVDPHRINSRQCWSSIILLLIVDPLCWLLIVNPPKINSCLTVDCWPPLLTVDCQSPQINSWQCWSLIILLLIVDPLCWLLIVNPPGSTLYTVDCWASYCWLLTLSVDCWLLIPPWNQQSTALFCLLYITTMSQCLLHIYSSYSYIYTYYTCRKTHKLR